MKQIDELKDSIDYLESELQEANAHNNYYERVVIPKLIKALERVLPYLAPEVIPNFGGPDDVLVDHLATLVERYKDASPGEQPKVVVEVHGGVASIEECPSWIDTVIIDHDLCEEEE